ncbi:hypothetical protein JCM6882_006789 [Rhodosporidiobolus microsporus]
MQHPLAGVGYSQQQLPSTSTAAAYAPPPPRPAYTDSPESHTSVARPPPKKAARKSIQSGAGDEDGDGDEPARKKSKQSLSCGECKCDRKIPCSSCIKRGAPDSCNWEDAKIEPEKQPFALVDDVDDLKERLAIIERFLNTLPPALKTSMPELGIKSFGMRAKNDVRVEQIANDEYVEVEKHLASIREGNGAGDSLGVLDAVLFGGDNMLPKGALQAVQAPPELTPALTSIIAPRVVWVEPATSTNLGLDICYNQEELDAERLRALEKVYRLLPTKEQACSLIKRYYAQFEWFFALLHHPSFEAEVVQFYEMVEKGRRYEVDPAWLALFYLVLALASDQTMHMNFDSPMSDPGEWLDKGAALQAAATKLMYLSDCFGKPQVRIIMCTVLLACWTVISAHGGEYGRFSSWLACAIRSAQKLGLHRLTDDPENMPPDDPAWPPGKNAVKREGALRVWAFLTFFDHIAASARFKAYMIHPAHTTTPPLSNINSNELSPTDWRITPSPTSVLTDASLEYHKLMMAGISRKTFDLLVAGGSAFNYGQILTLDREYRELLENMPDVFQHEHTSMEEKDPIIRGKRYIALQGVHNRIVRLHRPFLVKGWDHPKFAYSTEACIKSAKTVLVAHHNNLDVNKNLRMMYSHTLSASIVLAADLFHAIDTGASETETESKREILAMALEVFSEKVQNRVASRHLRVIIESARRVLTGLFLEQEKRRVRRAALAVTGETPSNEKPFAEILQNLARQVDGSSAADARKSPVVSQPSNGNLILSPAPNQVPTPTAIPLAPDPLSLAPLPSGFDATLPSAYTATNPGPVNNSLTNNLFQDLGLIPFSDGQSFDYWTQAQPAAAQPMAGSYDGSSSGADTSPLDLAAFLGVGANGNTDQATQALLSQMAGGW